MKPSVLIPPEAREEIEAAVREAEQGTAGEIVVSVVRCCDPHRAAPWRVTAWLAAGIALAAQGWAPAMPPLVLLTLCGAAGVLAHALCRVDAIRRVFLTEDECQSVAEREALRAFGEHGLRRTVGRTGVLIFVALLEHRVVVLGDEAVDRALGAGESWQRVVDAILAGIRSGRASEGIVDAVRICGGMLAHPLPPRPAGTDEIPHGLILED